MQQICQTKLQMFIALLVSITQIMLQDLKLACHISYVGQVLNLIPFFKDGDNVNDRAHKLYYFTAFYFFSFFSAK